MGPVPKPGVLEIAPYVAARGEARRILHQLASNESTLGPSPAAIEAYRSAASDIHLYPDGGAHDLRKAVAAHHGIDGERIVCGNGSDELLTLIAHAYVCPGDEVLFSEHAFIVYRLAALASSATPVAAPEPALRIDVDRMLERVTPKTRIVYLANPNNPTGSYISDREVRRLHEGLSPGTLLVIDSAYAEYMQAEDYDPGTGLISRSENVVMTRTFSKAHGLAGLRVGWAYCPAAVAGVLNRVRGPFNVSVAAQRAALAALGDQAHLERAVTHNRTWRNWLIGEIRKSGLEVTESFGNFVLIRFPEAGNHTAKAADAFLLERGIALRPVAAYGLPHCLRLTVGVEEANRATVAVLRDFMRSP